MKRLYSISCLTVISDHLIYCSWATRYQQWARKCSETFIFNQLFTLLRTSSHNYSHNVSFLSNYVTVNIGVSPALANCSVRLHFAAWLIVADIYCSSTFCTIVKKLRRLNLNYCVYMAISEGLLVDVIIR